MVKIETHLFKNHDFSWNLIHFIPQKIQKKKVVILLPGAGYSYLGPLFYYPTQWLLQNGVVVIAFDYDFRNFVETIDYKIKDAFNFCITEGLQFVQQKYPEYEYSFIAKSIGTSALCQISQRSSEFHFKFSECKTVWLTPLLNQENCFEEILKISNPSLLVMGTNDPQYLQSKFELLLQNKNIQSLLIPSADHSLNHNRVLHETFQIHKQVCDLICQFLV